MLRQKLQKPIQVFILLKLQQVKFSNSTRKFLVDGGSTFHHIVIYLLLELINLLDTKRMFKSVSKVYVLKNVPMNFFARLFNGGSRRLFEGNLWDALVEEHLSVKKSRPLSHLA